MAQTEFPMQVSELRLSYRSKVKAADRPACSNSGEAHRILRGWWDADTIELFEEFFILLVDRARRCMGIYRAGQGSTVGVIVDPKLIFGTAIKCRADAIIVAHNHPSGQLCPSQADRQLTQKLVQAGELLELPVIDHLIVSPEGGYYSFADEGLM